MATAKQKDSIKEKLEYIGLNLEKIPRYFKEFEPLEFIAVKEQEEAQYKQYRYIPVKDIQILLSPTHRLDPIDKKYKNASPIYDYLDSTSERNVTKHATFLKMLKEVKIEDIQKVENEQKELMKRVPFRVKYDGNYLWQIYYSEATGKYFMIVPTEDYDNSTFFYLLKRQLETRRAGKIFVPIRNMEYSSKFLKPRQFEEVENYLWMFTKDWPLIYEVHDKMGNMSIQMVGETEVYPKIKSSYRIRITSREEASRFYKLLKALFIIQTELPNLYKFNTNINKSGGIEFNFEKELVEYQNISTFINEQYKKYTEQEKEITKSIKKYEEMLKELKIEATTLDLEYLTKERQISTFLECKKTFFGKVKYYFKYSKKKSLRRDKNKKEEKEQEETEPAKTVLTKTKQYTKVVSKSNYTLEELIKQCKEYEKIETNMKNLLMDINAIKLKNKNMRKKIENATSFIQEIDNHKKSIFEFWKYTNKDEVAALAEGEAEEINIVKKVKKVFDYEQDLEKFGERLDEIQRNILTKDEMDSIFLTTTSQLPILNKVKNNRVLPKDIENSLKQIKREQREAVDPEQQEEFDIFGGTMDTKVREVNSKRYREVPKDKFRILDVNKNSKQIGYKLTLERMIENINKALSKIKIEEDIVVYKAVSDGRLRANAINIFDTNPEAELKRAFTEINSKITLLKVNLNKGTNAIGYTNSIYYDNQHRTLPKGMDFDSRILVDTTRLELEQIDRAEFKIIRFENEKDDFTGITIRSIDVAELNQKEDEEEEN